MHSFETTTIQHNDHDITAQQCNNTTSTTRRYGNNPTTTKHKRKTRRTNNNNTNNNHNITSIMSKQQQKRNSHNNATAPTQLKQQASSRRAALQADGSGSRMRAGSRRTPVPDSLVHGSCTVDRDRLMDQPWPTWRSPSLMVRECLHRECLLKGKIKNRHCWVTTKKKTKKSPN